jgi:hypothetical protein
VLVDVEKKIATRHLSLRADLQREQLENFFLRSNVPFEQELLESDFVRSFSGRNVCGVTMEGTHPRRGEVTTDCNSLELPPN